MKTQNEDLILLNESLDRFKLLKINLAQAGNKKNKENVERNIELELSSLKRRVKLKNYDLNFESTIEIGYLIYQLENIIEIIKNR
ncbi:hypothetical protein HXZ91_04830 [Myroides odoratimimus]|uniref:hypothetical protein n=1 Tax=Myroides odoratimimus TaxID=76832 RepID=UPI0025791135|nr:hypothetical protein [Myroides odoratimimus]MDM1033803.1 hypothetical protein [Myroides odoratimimus]